MAKRKYSPGKDGVYSTLVWDGTYNKDGSKHRKQLRSLKSSADLEKIVNKFKADVENRNILQKTDITFLQYARNWRQVYKAKVSMNTRKMYDNIIEKHLVKLDGVGLQDIGRMHLYIVLNDANAPTGRQIFITFKQIVKSAVKDKYLPPITIDDIFGDEKAPKAPKREKRPLTDIEKQGLLNAVFKTPMDRMFVYLIYGCGVRREEALAVQFPFDFNFTDNTVAINKVIVFDGNEPVLKYTPKSENGYRLIPMPASLVHEVKSYGKTLNGGGFMFFTQGRELMTKSSYDKMWSRIVTAINHGAGGTNDLQVVYGLTAHIFRHNYCTNLCYQIPTISIKKIAELMGDTEKVVLDVYDHIIASKEDPRTAIENAVGW